MGVSAIYDGVFDTYNIRQVKNTDVQTNYQSVSDRYSGGLDPQQVSIISADPVVTFETMDIAGVISNVSATAGLAKTSAATITIPWADRADCSTFEGSTSHQTISATLGLLVPTEISADQDDEGGATCKMEFYPASTDGLASPIAINTSATLASQAFVGTYDLGPVKIASTFIGNVKSWRLMFGIKCTRRRFNGYSYSRISDITIDSRDPILEVTFFDTSSAQSAGLFASIASTVTAFLRARAAGSTHTADASAAHISCTLTGGLHLLDNVSGSGQDDVSCVRRFVGKSLAFSSAVAIA